MKNLIVKIIFIFIILSLLSCSKPPLVNSESYINNEFENVSDITTKYRIRDISYEQRNISYTGEGHFFIRRVDFNSNKGNYTTSYFIPGDKGEINYFDENKELISRELKDGKLPLKTILIVETDKYSMILSQAYSYKDLGNGTKDSYPETYPVEIEKQEGYWKVTYNYKNMKDYHGIMWGVGSDKRLVNLDDKNQRKIWSNYDISNNSRLAEDGYYYKSPDSYRPATENSFWRNPSMYIVQSWIKTGGSLAADILGRSFLLIGSDNINEEGYLPTLPESNWLKTDYDIGAGFFDTRFNADIGDTYLEAYKKFDYSKFRDSYLELANYYSNHIYKNHYKVFNTDGEEGWLVQDYAYKAMYKPTHVSLNHHIHAANWFLKMYEIENEKSFEDIALKMLKGVKITRDKWIKTDKNLHYSYRPDGTMGGNDYPYLTYNDLLLFQKTYSRIYGKLDDDIEILMESKKQWMDNNGVVDYLKF